jgi:hypothetical protein
MEHDGVFLHSLMPDKTKREMVLMGAGAGVLVATERPMPQPAAGEVRIRVREVTGAAVLTVDA